MINSFCLRDQRHCLGLLISTLGILYTRKSSSVRVRISYTKRHGAQHLPIQKSSLIMTPWPIENILFQVVNHQGHYHYHHILQCQNPSHTHSLRRFSPLVDAISPHELEVWMLFVYSLDAYIAPVSHTCVPAWRNALIYTNIMYLIYVSNKK